MSRSSRYPHTSNITSNAKAADNGYGGLKRAASATTVVTSYKFNAWPMTMFQRSRYIEEYGLAMDSDLVRITGAYNAAIEAGQFITYNSKTYKLITVNRVNGRNGTPTALAIEAHRVIL